MKNNDLKVLILSHNALSDTQNNGKTLSSFFYGWSKDSLAQIFLQPEIPDFTVCNNFYRMSDYEILNNFIYKGSIGNEIFEESKNNDNIQNLSSNIQKLYLERRKSTERKGLNKLIHDNFVRRTPSFVLIRNLLWGKKKWINDNLINWINNFKPDVLFFQGSSAAFGYEIALWICNEFKIPLILELTDDYTCLLYRYSIIERSNLNKYLKLFKKAIKYASTVCVISDDMMYEYKKKFGGNYNVIMNSVNIPAVVSRDDFLQPIKLVYAGNVFLNRWKVLNIIGEALVKIKKENGIDASLDIYSPIPIPQKIVNELQKTGNVKYKGFLSSKELKHAISVSNILVHVESFDEKMRRITRLSISTKIPEYMASGKCILAVGPKDVASINYLSINDCAFVLNDIGEKSMIENILIMFRNHALRETYSQNALAVCKNRHDGEKMRKNIYDMVKIASINSNNVTRNKAGNLL